MSAHRDEREPIHSPRARSSGSLRSVCGWLAAGVGLALSSGAPASPAAAESFCQGYARDAVEAQQKNLDLGCGLTGGPWTLDYAGHESWCRTQDREKVEAGSQARHDMLERCETICPTYADAAVQRQDQNIIHQCNLTGGPWSHDWKGHYSWCMGQPRDVLAEGTQGRTCAIQLCTHPGHSADNPVGASARGQLTVDYAYPLSRERTETVQVATKDLRDVFDRAWEQASRRLCDEERAKPGHSAWHYCNPGMRTALFVQPEGPRVLSFTYAVDHTALSFDKTQETILGSWADPTILVSFDVTTFLQVRFASKIDPDSSEPIVTIVSSDGCLSDASVNSAHVAASEESLQEEEEHLRNRVPRLNALHEAVAQMNEDLRSVVRSLPSHNLPKQVFLRVSMNGSDIALHLERRGGLAGSVSERVPVGGDRALPAPPEPDNQKVKKGGQRRR